METMSLPKVIACLPSYNAAEFIGKTLLCLKKQNYPNFEVLISDDCSTDNTISVIQSFIKNDERFHLIQQESNLGWVDNINFLMEKAVKMGEYTFIMPHDDQIKPNYIQKLANTLEKHPSAVHAFSDMECIFLGGKTKILKYPQLEGISERRKRTKKLLQSKGSWGTAYRGMTRSNAVNKIIPLKKNIIGRRDYAVDWIWLIKLSIEGEFIRIPEVLYRKNYKINSASFFWSKGNANLIVRLADFNRNLLGLLVNCSSTLWQLPISFQEKLIFQNTIFFSGSKRLILGSGSLIKRSVFKKIVTAIKQLPMF